MRAPISTVVAVSVSVFGLVLASACGSDPKPDPAAPTAPSADPAAAVSSATPASASASASAAQPSAPSAPVKSDKQTECDGLRDDANSTLDAKQIEFAEKTCKKDADCVLVKGRACNFDCVSGAVPKAQEKAWTEAVSKVKDGACKKWNDNDCAKLRTKPPPTCQDRKVGCEKNRCTLKT